MAANHVYDDSTFETFFANPPEGLEFDALDRSRIPRHISCIMDGNGRWATAQGLSRGEGHKAGIVSLREIITACVRLGVEVMSAYASPRRIGAACCRGEPPYAPLRSDVRGRASAA